MFTTGNGDQTDLIVLYKVCNTSEEENNTDCFFSDEEAKGSDPNALLLDLQKTETRSGDDSIEAVETSLSYSGFILHEPSVECPDPSICKYVFSLWNPSTLATPRQISFQANILRTD